jgi:RNA polymerase sigma-70 factor (ECF subfamily)
MGNPRPSRKASVSAGLQLSSRLSPDLRESYRQYFPRVFAYVYGRIRDSKATEDLASEAFRQAFAKADPLSDEGAFEIRLFTIARDLLTSHCRDQSPREHTPEDDLLQRPDRARVLSHLRHLHLRDQDIIALKFDAELTNPQIAQVMGLSEGKVGVILYRTLRKLHKALEQEP